MNNPQHFSTISSLFWIGQSFTILVIILDIFAIIENRATHMFMKELESYQLKIVHLNLVIECLFSGIIIIILLLLTFCFTFCHTITEKLIEDCFSCFFCPIFCCIKTEYKEALLWFLVLGFIPPLWSFLSHLGYVFGGWISYEDRSIALILFYLFSFIFLFWSLQYFYRYIIDLYLSIYKKGTRCDYKEELEKYKKRVNEIDVKISALILMSIPCLLLNSIIVCIGYVFVHLPVLESIDDALTRTYILGEYTFIFAIFFLTYNLIHLKGEKGNSGGGLINKEVLKFWKYLYNKRAPNINNSENIKDLPDIHSDKDRAQLLMAALIHKFMFNNVNQEQCYDALLVKIMEEGGEQPQQNNEQRQGSEPLAHNETQV